MSLLFFDGFNYYANSTEMALYWTGGVTGIGLNSGGVGAPRSGQRDIFTGATAEFITSTLTPGDATCIVGIAFQTPTLAAGNLIEIREGTTIHMAVALKSDGALEVKRGATILETTAAGLVAINTWVYLSFKTTINNTTGSYDLYVDLSSVASDTNVDTQNGGTAAWTNVLFRGLSGIQVRFDDVYVLDGVSSGISGALNNDILGNVRVTSVLPSTDATSPGTYADFTPSSGSDHGAMVDEATPDGDTTYNAGTAAAQKDTYQYPALSISGATIHGVKTAAYARKTDAGARTVGPFIRSGGSDYQGTEVSLPTSYTFLTEIFQADPDTGVAWTEAGVDATQFGLEVRT